MYVSILRRALGGFGPVLLGIYCSASSLAADVLPLPPVVTAAVTQKPVVSTVSTYGTLSPKTEDLSFQISGRIARFNVDEGDRVTKGQLLAQLATQDAQDQVNKQKVELDQSQRNFKRMETLHGNGSIQQSQLEDARDRLEQSRIGYEQAKLNLQRCSLRASSDGLILREFLDSRTTVTAGQPIYSFQSHSEEWVTVVDLTDRNAFALGEGATAEVRFAPYPGVVFSGELTRVARVANPDDSLYASEVTLVTQGHELRPGMVAEVDLSRISDKLFTSVPLDALLDVRGVSGTVYLLDSETNSVVERRVTIQSIQGEEVALAEPLEGYTEVVVRGHQNLRDGSSVNVVRLD
jgi:RND family efflux transporter MFP subunit